MAELSLRDRLQPALLDRLTDEDRLVTVYRVVLDPARLAAARLSELEVERSLGMQGLRRLRDAAGGAQEYVAQGGAARQVSPKTLRVLGSTGEAVPLATLGEVEATTSPNAQIESAERRAMSMTKLREAVLRDLRWLFNATGIDDVVDLEPYPEVRRSVVNFGLRSLAGKPISSVEPLEVARRIRDAIRFFEPRLSHVNVQPEKQEDEAQRMNLAFVVEAELWGQPVAQHLSLRTSIDMETGDVVVADRSGRA